MVSISPLEATLLFVITVGLYASGAGCGVLLFVYGLKRLLRSMGLTVYLGYADRPVTAADGDKDEPAKTSEPESQPEQEGDAEDGEGGERPQMPIGQCRGCRLPHAGLCPATVHMTITGMVIPDGTPFVCPRCWVGLNPGDRTNIARGGIGPQVVENTQAPKPTFAGRAQMPAEPPVTLTVVDEVAPMAEEVLEKETAPDITCDKCGCKGKENPRVSFREMRAPGGASTGKFWCQSCVDALGGPGEKKPRRK